MQVLDGPGRYRDPLGNRIDVDQPLDPSVRVQFYGERNRLEVVPGATPAHLNVVFWCSDGYCRLGGALQGDIRIGERASVVVGDGVTCTGPCYLASAEGVTLTLGDDCMLARHNEVRADDAHPIFDVRTGARVNPSRAVTVGRHVWLADRAVVLAGSVIGDGSVIGFGSIVKGRIPNNCVAAGAPARVIRTDCAWERSHLSLTPPFFKPDAGCVTKTERYWHPTATPR